MMLRTALAALALATLAGCYSIGDGTYFNPQHMPSRATTSAELKLIDEQLLSQPAPPNSRLAGRLPAKLTHDLVQLGPERIAFTRVTPAQPRANEPLIVLCGGNATDRLHSGVYNVGKLLPWGEVLLFDYPGYGDSTGKPTAASILPEMKFVAQHIDAMAKGRPLILWGHSIGGLVCAQLAHDSREADAFIIETSAPNASAIIDKRRPGWAALVNIQVGGAFKGFDAPDTLKGFDAPLLVLGATLDETLPVALARDYAKRLEADGHAITYKEYPAADHHSVTNQPALPADMTAFLAKVSDTRR